MAKDQNGSRKIQELFDSIIQYHKAQNVCEQVENYPELEEEEEIKQQPESHKTQTKNSYKGKKGIEFKKAKKKQKHLREEKYHNNQMAKQQMFRSK